MSLVKVQNSERYGLVKIREDERVTDFLEKAPMKSCEMGYVNAGVNVFEKRILDYITSGIEVSLEREVFPELVRREEPIYGYVTNGYFIDIGTQEDYYRFQNDVLRVIKH
jgi:NDP-sugar pyrophosphorylase family protein